MLPRHPAIERRDDDFPVAQQEERHDRGDEDERQHVGDGDPAGQHAAQEIADPAHQLLQLLAGRVLQLVHVFGRQPVLQQLEQRIQLVLADLHIGREAVDELPELRLEQRYQQQHEGDDHDQRRDQHERGADRARHVPAFQPPDQRVEKERERRADEKRQQNRAQHMEGISQDQDDPDPEQRACPGSGHRNRLSDEVSRCRDEVAVTAVTPTAALSRKPARRPRPHGRSACRRACRAPEAGPAAPARF